MDKHDQLATTRREVRNLILAGRVYQNENGANYLIKPDNEYSNKTFHDSVVAVLLRLNKLVLKCTDEELQESIMSMGAGCIFDDFKSDDERKGALKVLFWIECSLAYGKENTGSEGN